MMMMLVRTVNMLMTFSPKYRTHVLLIIVNMRQRTEAPKMTCVKTGKKLQGPTSFHDLVWNLLAITGSTVRLHRKSPIETATINGVVTTTLILLQDTRERIRSKLRTIPAILQTIAVADRILLISSENIIPSSEELSQEFVSQEDILKLTQNFINMHSFIITS